MCRTQRASATQIRARKQLALAVIAFGLLTNASMPAEEPPLEMRLRYALKMGDSPILLDPTLALSPDGQTLACKVASRFSFWDVKTGNKLGEFTDESKKTPKHRRDFVFQADGKSIRTYGVNGAVFDLAVPSGKLIRECETRKLESSAVAMSPDGQLVAVGNNKEATIVLFDAASGKERAVLRGHGGPDSVKFKRVPGSGTGKIVTSLAFTADSKTLVSGGQDTSVRVWDVTTGKQVAVFPGHEITVNTVALSPDGKTVAVGSGKSVRLWDIATKKERLVVTAYGAASALAFRRDGKVLAHGRGPNSVGGAATVVLWDVSTGKELASFMREGIKVNTLLFAADGAILLSAINRDYVTAWDVRAK